MELYERPFKKLLQKQLTVYRNFGIIPTKPETGYGYIKGDDVVSRKPNQVMAREFI
jgi:mannose-1-phosphate guanylyltransferase